MTTISNYGPHKARRSSCFHCKQKSHNHDKISGNTHRFHEASGKCPYYRTHKRPRMPRFYSACVTPSGISKVHKAAKHKVSVKTTRTNKPPKYSLWKDVKGYGGRKKRSTKKLKPNPSVG